MLDTNRDFFQGAASLARLLGVTQDLTDRRDADREIAARGARAEALVEWESFEAGARGLLARLGSALECSAGIFWVPAGDVLEPRVLWHAGANRAAR